MMADEERASNARSLPSVIGTTVVMKGDLVVGEDLVIEGTYDGTIDAQDTVTLRKSAHVCGEVRASRLQIEDGTNLKNAVLSGRICRAER